MPDTALNLNLRIRSAPKSAASGLKINQVWWGASSIFRSTGLNAITEPVTNLRICNRIIGVEPSAYYLNKSTYNLFQRFTVVRRTAAAVLLTSVVSLLDGAAGYG